MLPTLRVAVALLTAFGGRVSCRTPGVAGGIRSSRGGRSCTSSPRTSTRCWSPPLWLWGWRLRQGRPMHLSVLHVVGVGIALHSDCHFMFLSSGVCGQAAWLRFPPSSWQLAHEVQPLAQLGWIERSVNVDLRVASADLFPEFLPDQLIAGPFPWVCGLLLFGLPVYRFACVPVCLCTGLPVSWCTGLAVYRSTSRPVWAGSYSVNPASLIFLAAASARARRWSSGIRFTTVWARDSISRMSISSSRFDIFQFSSSDFAACSRPGASRSASS